MQPSSSTAEQEAFERDSSCPMHPSYFREFIVHIWPILYIQRCLRELTAPSVCSFCVEGYDICQPVTCLYESNLAMTKRQVYKNL
jgi:hypothetical protein